MARKGSDFYNTIEYIGPRPQKPKKTNFFGGWVILAIAGAAVFFIGKPLIGDVMATEKLPTGEHVEWVTRELAKSSDFPNLLAAEALRNTTTETVYDSAYYHIDYPNGDIPPQKGLAADLIVRCYRKLGIDLQKEIHEDMKKHFRLYPQLWQAAQPDPNIDHRRVPNLQRFLSRKGVSLPTSNEAKDYQVGDIVIWALPNADIHIGIVAPSFKSDSEDGALWVVHHPAGDSIRWDNTLFDHCIIGHFRYPITNE